MSKNDGGPAYPHGKDVYKDFDRQYGNPGMTLRDYFAGQALAGICAQEALWRAMVRIANCREERESKPVSSLAYDLADAMLAEREK